MAGHVYAVPVPRPNRAPFNLSFEYKTTMDMGMLIPVCKEGIPGDVMMWDLTTIIRLQPLLAPVLHNIRFHAELFFVPYRLLWENPADADDTFEQFVTGGEDGDNAATFPDWNPATKTVGSLWDYLTFPVGITPADRQPSALPARAYSLIWNEWYRPQEIVDPGITIDMTGGTDTSDYAIKYRMWSHDYFTSALYDQQRGDAPALSVTISGDGGDVTMYNANDATNRPIYSKTGAASEDRLGLSTNPTGAGNAR